MNERVSESTRTLVVSYLGIRRAIGLVGLFLPILLGPVGWFVFGIEIQDNMSSYYHTALRDVFVGAMCAIGIFLFCYRGYDWIESWTANIGCVSALGVALCPLDAHSEPLNQSSIVGYLHTISGGAFFFTLAFYSLYHFPSAKQEKHEVAPARSTTQFHLSSQWRRDFTQRGHHGGLSLSDSSGVGERNQTNLIFCSGGNGSRFGRLQRRGLPRARAILADIAVDLMALPSHLLERRKHH